MRKIICLIFGLIFLIQPIFLQAQEKLLLDNNLASFLRLVIAQNTTIQNQRYNLEISTFSVTEQLGAFDPQLGFQTVREQDATGNANSWLNKASLSKKFAYGTSLALSAQNTRIDSPLTYASTVGVELTQPLFKDFGDQVSQFSYLSQLQEQQKDYATFVDTLSQTLQAALDTYGQYFISLKKQDILQKSVEANQYLLDQNRKKLILQTVPETEVLAAQVALQNAKADLASAQNNTQKLRLDLQLLIAQTQLPLIPVTQNVFLVTYNADNLPTTNFLAQNPKLKIAQIDLAKSQLSLTYYQNQALPQFDLIASLGSAKTDTNFGNTWSFSSPTYTLGFSLGLPLGNNQANAKLAKQQLALKQAQLNLANVQQDLANQSAKAQLDVSFQQANIQNYQLVVQSAEQKLKLNKQQFDLGLITTDKVITAETDLATAQQNLDQAYVNYVIAIFVLEGLKGNPLSWDY